MQTIKKTPTRVKFDGMTFLHNGKCVEGNHEPKEYLILNNVRYYKVKNTAVLEDIADQFDYETTIELPTKEELQQVEHKKLVVNKDGQIDSVAIEKIIYDPKYPGRKTKAKFWNPKSGAYVGYIRAAQLKIS